MVVLVAELGPQLVKVLDRESEQGSLIFHRCGNGEDAFQPVAVPNPVLEVPIVDINQVVADQRGEDVNQAEVFTLVYLDVLEALILRREHKVDVTLEKKVYLTNLVRLDVDVRAGWCKVFLQVETHPSEERTLALIHASKEANRAPDLIVDVAACLTAKMLG